MPIIVKKFAIRYYPPSLIVEYDKNGKLRRRRIPLRLLNEKSKPQTILDEITKKHADILGGSITSHIQLKKLLNRIIDSFLLAKEKTNKSSSANAATISISSNGNSNIIDSIKGISEDLNKLDDQELKKVKSKMDVVFQQNQKKPGDPEYEYDKRIDFKPTDSNEWDEDDELEEELDLGSDGDF